MASAQNQRAMVCLVAALGMLASLAPDHACAQPEPPTPAQVEQAPEPEPSKPPAVFGGLDFNLYPYLARVEGDSVFTLNAFAKLPYGLSYFGFINVMNQAGRTPLTATDGYYTEQNLRFAPLAAVPLDLTVQYNMQSGENNDRLRFGTRWRLGDTPLLDAVFDAIHLEYAINVHLVQLDHDNAYVWQLEQVGKLTTPYLDHRLYLSGFADHTFNSSVPPGVPAAPIVAEVQLGVRLLEQLHAVVEYRVNQYRVGAETNVALGAEYLIKW